MKFKNIWAVGVVSLFVLLFVAMSFDGTSENTYFVTDEDGTSHEYNWAGAKPYQYTYARDTMSTAGSSVVDVPWLMVSAYQYNYYIRLRKIGVTPNIKVVLDEANSSGSVLWSPIDSVSCSGADSTKVHFRLRGTTVYGAKHRLRFVKTGATTVQRDIILNIKPSAL